jgi:glutamyl-tRNA synthetase
MYRFAPSPIGDMHIGNLRVALFNYISAKQKGEKLLIRIEDIDTQKNIAGKDQEILEILALFGISWDQVAYQSHNLKFHQQLATKLLMDKNAFTCFCTPQELEADMQKAKDEKRDYQYSQKCTFLSDAEVMSNESDPFTVRIKRPTDDIDFKDLIKGDIHFDKKYIDSFLILRADKTPTHDFASSIDDMLSDISTVIVSEDHLPNAPKEILIRKYLKYDRDINYAHLPTILNEEGKEDDSLSVKWLLEEGFLPSAITNYLLCIGDETATEIFDIHDTIEWFNLDKFSKSPTKFNIHKLREINIEHIKKSDLQELAKFIGYSSKEIANLAKVYTQEASTINEIKAKIDKIFAPKVAEEFQEELKILKECAKDLPYCKEFDEFKDQLSQQSGLKGEKFFKTLNLLLIGSENGPNLSEIYPHIKNYLGEIIK